MADLIRPVPTPGSGAPALARHFLRLDKLDEALRDPALLALLAEGRDPLIGARHTTSDGEGRRIEGFLLLLGPPALPDQRLDHLLEALIGLRGDLAEARVNRGAAVRWHLGAVGVGASATAVLVLVLGWAAGG